MDLNTVLRKESVRKCGSFLSVHSRDHVLIAWGLKVCIGRYVEEDEKSASSKTNTC